MRVIDLWNYFQSTRDQSQYYDYHESEGGGTVGPSADVRGPSDPVENVIFAAEAVVVKQQVGVVRVVDQGYPGLVRTDLEVVNDVSNKI